MDTLKDAIARVRTAATEAVKIHETLPATSVVEKGEFDETPTVMGVLDRILEEMARQERMAAEARKEQMKMRLAALED